MIPKTKEGIEKEIKRLKEKEEYNNKKKEYLKLKKKIEPNFFSMIANIIEARNNER